VICWLLASASWLQASLRTPRERDRNVARAAEQSIVFKPALAATISDGNNVIRFPARTRGAPRPSSRAIGHGRFRSRPLPVRLKHIEPADLTNPLIPLLDLLSNVPRAASNLPFVNAPVAAERAPRRFDDAVAPATDWFTRRIALGLAPLFGGNDAGSAGAHAGSYRQERMRPLTATAVPPKGGSDKRQPPTKEITHPP
jgi:hypothetical protein